MYGSFLIEAASILADPQVVSIGKKFHDVAALWDEIADDLWQLSLTLDQSLCEKISTSLTHIHELEKSLYTSLLDKVA